MEVFVDFNLKVGRKFLTAHWALVSFLQKYFEALGAEAVLACQSDRLNHSNETDSALVSHKSVVIFDFFNHGKVY